jgi:glycosyltransferase involved in cell wall biosynthesis
LSEPVRILRAIARLNMGGPALNVAYLSKGLDARGYTTTLAAGRLAHGEDSMAFVAEDMGVRVLPIPAMHREVSPLYDPLAVTRMLQEIRRIRPHILHTHTAKAGAVGRAAALIAGDARPPIIVHTYHGHVLRGYFDAVRTEFFRETERALARNTTRLIAVGPEVRDDLVELGVAPAEKFTVIRLGIDLEGRVAVDRRRRAEYRALFGVRDETFVVGWIGRMTGIKRVSDVLLSLRRLLELGVDATLCMVGDGPDRVPAEREAKSLGIAKRVLWTGYQRDVSPYYSLFDALVLPSANEGTPVVAIEALAACCPVVATRVGGVPDVVSDGEDGFLVSVGDVPAIADSLARLARDAELRRRMGKRGRELVVPRYRVDRIVDDMDALYRELLSEKGLPLPPSA